MKLNGGFTATVAGVALTGLFSSAAYLNRTLNHTQERLAVVETRLNGIEKQLDLSAKKDDIRDLRIVIREALASALGRK